MIAWKSNADGTKNRNGKVQVNEQVTRGYWAVRVKGKIVSRHSSKAKALRRGSEILRGKA